MFYQTTDHGAVQRKKGFSGFLNWNNLDSSRPRKGSGTPGMMAQEVSFASCQKDSFVVLITVLSAQVLCS